jgi:O-acetyl-ADP-ribose deacetylase (regulator of RNase III)
MILRLVDRSGDLIEAWRRCFAGIPDVEIILGDICGVECDAVVSPANSFGFMDGGLDLSLSLRFGWDVQEHLQGLIRRLPVRELLVGQALLVPTQDDRVPWLISSPTMRLPASVEGTLNAYLAMKAVLSTALTAESDPPINSLAVPGLGTGVGRLDPRTAAHQMFAAYRETVLAQEFRPESLHDAALQEHKLIHAADFDEARPERPGLCP